MIDYSMDKEIKAGRREFNIRYGEARKMAKIEKMKNWSVNDPWFEGALGAKVNELTRGHNELKKMVMVLTERLNEIDKLMNDYLNEYISSKIN